FEVRPASESCITRVRKSIEYAAAIATSDRQEYHGRVLSTSQKRSSRPSRDQHESLSEDRLRGCEPDGHRAPGPGERTRRVDDRGQKILSFDTLGHLSRQASHGRRFLVTRNLLYSRPGRVRCFRVSGVMKSRWAS